MLVHGEDRTSGYREQTIRLILVVESVVSWHVKTWNLRKSSENNWWYTTIKGQCWTSKSNVAALTWLLVIITLFYCAARNCFFFQFDQFDRTIYMAKGITRMGCRRQQKRSNRKERWMGRDRLVDVTLTVCLGAWSPWSPGTPGGPGFSLAVFILSAIFWNRFFLIWILFAI